MIKKIFVILFISLLTACSAEQPKQQIAQVITEGDANEQEVETINESPVITINGDILKTEVNKPIDLLNGVSAVDYKGNKLKVEVSGQYYFNVAGTYKLEYVAKDSNELLAYKRFTLIVSEPKILCKSDPVKGTAPDNPYFACDYVFPEALKSFEDNTVMEFDPTDEGWKQCELEAQKYDKTKFDTDCMPLLDNIRNTAKVGLWVGERDNSVDRELFGIFQSYMIDKYGIKQIDTMAAELIGAVKGFKYTITDDVVVEIYLFAADSDAYKKILETGKVTLEGIGDFDITMNGYYGLFSEVYHEDIVNYFKSIK